VMLVVWAVNEAERSTADCWSSIAGKYHTSAGVAGSRRTRSSRLVCARATLPIELSRMITCGRVCRNDDGRLTCALRCSSSGVELDRCDARRLAPRRRLRVEECMGCRSSASRWRSTQPCLPTGSKGSWCSASHALAMPALLRIRLAKPVIQGMTLHHFAWREARLVVFNRSAT